MGTSDDFAHLDATAQADLVRTGAASPAELVDAAAARIERLDPTLNAVIHQRLDAARRDARAELPDGAFRGVPMVVKDLGLTQAGEPYHAGTRFLKALGHRAAADSYLAARFRAAGFVCMGRTNTPEFGTTVTTEPLSYGPTRNPWDTDQSTGGSSGGSAAAVASGMVAVGHANDGGGSIRVPASECGLVGLKPTRARVSLGPVTGESWMGATIDHVVVRSVRDSARVLDAIHGPMPGDPYAAPTPLRPFADEVGADPGRLRIGWSAAPTREMFSVHTDCVTAVSQAATALSALGHHVDEDRPAAFADPGFFDHFVLMIAASTGADINQWEHVIGRPITEEDIEPENWLFTQWGRRVSATDYLANVAWMHAWQRRMATWWAPVAEGGAGYDVLLTPTIATPPPLIGFIGEPGADNGFRVGELLQYTGQLNITGQPAISLPLHVNAAGLPIGVQLVAGYGREDVLIRLASQIEQAHPFALLPALP